MSIRLRELIRAVRQCKTAAEERNVIAKESAALRDAFTKQDIQYRHRNVAKLMYMHMLGYPTHFGQMETLKLIASNGFPEKRIGYLGLMILLDERQEVLMLVTNSLKNDLSQRNQYIVGLALCALGNICSAEMARDLAPEVEKLLASTNSYIRKKAALCATRVLRKVPELLEAFQDKSAALLNDRHHGVLLTGVTLMLEICDIDAAAITQYRQQVPTLCKVLKSLLMSGFAPEHDVGGITDPFLQVKILQLLKVLGSGSVEASDQMSDILAQVASNTESTRNAGNAILYECVQTIMGVESIAGLRVMAINILGRFLANKDNNMRYVALNTLAKAVLVDTQAVQRHRTTVVECVKDADVSIRRRALELVYALVNETNIKTLTKELLDYLKIVDLEFKPDLTAKICSLVQRFAPDKRWALDSLLQVMTQAGEHVKEEVCRSLVVMMTNAPPLHGYTVRSSYTALKANLATAQRSLVITATWFLGEFGDLLVNGGGGPLLEGEEAVSVSGPELLALLEAVVANKSSADSAGREYALTALMKLGAHLPSESARTKAIIERYTDSPQLEVQQRSCEYRGIYSFDAIRQQLLEAMPPLDESAYSRNLTDHGVLDKASAAPVAAANGAALGMAPATDLLSLDDEVIVPVASATSAAAMLDELLAGPPPSQTPGPALSGGSADIMDLLAGPSPSLAGSYPSVPAQPQAVDPLAMLMGGTSGPAAGGFDFMTPAAASPSFPAAKVYDRDGIAVTFNFTKPPGQPAVTDIEAVYVNTSGQPVSDFVLQVAVPKTVQLQLEPASGTVLPAAGAGSVTQKLRLNNTLHGQKALALRLRIVYLLAGAAAPTQDLVEVKNLPAGL